MVYKYIAYNESGELVKGKLSAASEEAATDLLDYVGYQVVNLKQYVPFLSLGKLTAGMYRMKPSEIILFYRQLALLLESGINIVTSLELLQEQADNRALKKVMTEVISDLRSGNQLSTALAKHPAVFSSIYCRLLGVGEQSGGLETVLRQIADYIEKDSVAVKNIKSALTYPVITALVAVVVIGVLITFVLPAFGDLYGSLGVELPFLVTLLIDATNKAQSYGIYLLLVVFAVAGLVYIYIRTPGGKYKKDKLVFSLPVMGRANHLGELARCCRSMALLFHAGLPLTEVMSLVIQGTGNSAMTRALEDVHLDMVKGEGLSGPMAKSSLFLPMMVQMVRVGEETGNLDTTLQAVARSYEAEAEDKTRAFIALIQPTLTIIIGLVIGLVALSLTSAMYSMYGQGF